MSETGTRPAYPALVIDGSSSSFFAGVLGEDGAWLAHQSSPEPALESLFSTVDAVLNSAKLELAAIRAYIYCEGPGSVLGLRLCAMAIETWKRIHATPSTLYAYNSLHLVAADLIERGMIGGDTLVISDWKKDTWNGLKICDGKPESVAPVTSTELTAWRGALYHLPARKGWQKPPEEATAVGYHPECLPRLTNLADLIEARSEVELYNSGLNTFQKWTPQRHGADASPT